MCNSKSGIFLLVLLSLGLLSIPKVVNAQEISNEQIYAAANNANCFVQEGIGPHNTNKDNWQEKIICNQSTQPAGYQPIQKWMIDTAVLIGGREDVIAAFSQLGVFNQTVSQN